MWTYSACGPVCAGYTASAHTCVSIGRVPVFVYSSYTLRLTEAVHGSLVATVDFFYLFLNVPSQERIVSCEIGQTLLGASMGLHALLLLLIPMTFLNIVYIAYDLG